MCELEGLKEECRLGAVKPKLAWSRKGQAKCTIEECKKQNAINKDFLKREFKVKVL